MSDNVISLKDKKKENKAKDLGENADKENMDFENIMEMNRIKKEKADKERAKNNKSTLRSYRLKT